MGFNEHAGSPMDKVALGEGASVGKPMLAGGLMWIYE